MKIIFTLQIALIFILSTAFMSRDTMPNGEPMADINLTQKVYICGGQYATKFHSTQNCKGLNNCKAPVYSMESQQEAKNKGYSHCSLCWK